MLRKICQEQTFLTDAEIRHLEQVQSQLVLMAELTVADVFIDCITKEGKVMVVAQARPSTLGSAYAQSVVGEYAQPENEPAVFHTLQSGAPSRDIKAVTQENRVVRQDVVPVLNADGKCIAALIREQDITSDLLQEKKYRTLTQTYESEDLSLRSSEAPSQDTTAMREIHHRVKNNLQLVASILNLQSRRCNDEFTKKILQENVSRVLSIASIHDILTKNEDNFREIDSINLLEQLRKNLQSFVPDGKHIDICVTGTSAKLSADIASAVSLVVNELITNALEHAFEGRDHGTVTVSFCAGQLFHSVTVSDDGGGFDPARLRKGSLGLNIVEATVRDRLHGQLNIHSDACGSRVSFDIKTE